MSKKATPLKPRPNPARWADAFEKEVRVSDPQHRMAARRAVAVELQARYRADAALDLPVGPVTFPASTKRIAFFLGAGMSVPFGYPTTLQILPRIWEAIRPATTAPWRKWAGYRTGSLARHKEDIRDFRRFLISMLPGLKAGFDGTSASIIDVISMVEHSIMERYSPFALKDGPRPTVVAPQFDLLKARHLLTLGINGVLQGKKERAVREKFAQWMQGWVEGRTPRRVSIISTNYDTTIDQALYSLLGDSAGMAVDMGISWRTPSGEQRGPKPEAPYGVFKLHGSLNWLRCETCGHVVVSTKKRIATLDSWRIQNDFNSCECGGLLKSLLVTPSIVRNIRDATLLSLWNAALEDLRLADEWVMIGYSMPSEDIAIRSLLLRAFHSRENASLRIWVVSYDPGHLLEDKRSYLPYRSLFPEENFSLQDYSGEGSLRWVKRLIQ